MEESSRNTYFWVAVVVAIILLGGVLFYIIRSQGSASSALLPPITSSSPSEQPTPEAAATSPDSVTVSDQGPGNSVTIDKVFLQNPGFIAIHLADAQGNPGTIIGHSASIQGDITDLKISLSRSVKAGQTVIAMLHNDDGDKVFKYPGPDAPLTDVQGDTIMMSFNIVSSSITASPSPSATPKASPTPLY